MGAGIASGHEMGIKQQGRGMGLQAAAIASQIDLNNSQAEKNRADAKKTSGVDTEMQNANIDYVIAQTSNEKNQKRTNPCQHKTIRRSRRITKSFSRLYQTKSR